MNKILEPSDISEKTPGQIIKAAREVKGISITEAMQKLLLSKQVVIALEEDNYSKISAPVYAEGYLKAYAKFLQIPVDTILKSFRRLSIYPAIEIKANNQPRDESKLNIDCILKNQRLRIVLLGIVAALVLGMITFFVSKLFAGKSSQMVVATDAIRGDSEGIAIQNTTDKGATREQEKEHLPMSTSDITELNLEKKGISGKSSQIDDQSAADMSALNSLEKKVGPKKRR